MKLKNYRSISLLIILFFLNFKFCTAYQSLNRLEWHGGIGFGGGYGGSHLVNDYNFELGKVGKIYTCAHCHRARRYSRGRYYNQSRPYYSGSSLRAYPWYY